MRYGLCVLLVADDVERRVSQREDECAGHAGHGYAGGSCEIWRKVGQSWAMSLRNHERMACAER